MMRSRISTSTSTGIPDIRFWFLDENGLPRRAMGILESPAETHAPVIAGAKCPDGIAGGFRFAHKDGHRPAG